MCPTGIPHQGAITFFRVCCARLTPNCPMTRCCDFANPFYFWEIFPKPSLKARPYQTVFKIHNGG